MLSWSTAGALPPPPPYWDHRPCFRSSLLLVTRVLHGLSQDTVVSKPCSPGHSYHRPLLQSPRASPCLVPGDVELAGGQWLPWCAQPSILKNTAYESAARAWDKGTFWVLGILAFPLTPAVASSHCVRDLGVVAWVVSDSFMFLSGFKRL